MVSYWRYVKPPAASFCTVGSACTLTQTPLEADTVTRIILAIVLIIATASPVPGRSLIADISNSGFESGADGWAWGAFNGCEATIRSEATNPHSGKSALVFSNNSPTAPGVYARLSRNVIVLPETEYELSIWVRGTDVSDSGGAVPHFTDWATYTFNLPSGTYGWTRVKTTFTTKAGQGAIQLGLNLTNTCKELVIDDIMLRPVGTALKGGGVEASFMASPKVIGHDSPASVLICADSVGKGSVVEARVSSEGRDIFRKRGALKPGFSMLEWEWSSGKAPFGKLDVAVRLLDTKGRVLAQGTRQVDKIDSPIAAELEALDARFRDEFRPLYARCCQRGIAVDYPTATKETLEQFMPFAKQDAREDRDWRAQQAARDFRRMLDEGIAEMRAYLANPDLSPNTRRYVTSKADIDGISFIANRVDGRGKKDRGPVFFNGYGHFYSARKDMPRWPRYGVNIIQSAEFGPSAVLLDESTVSLDYPKMILRALDDAAKHNVKVDILLSPHYFPGWVYKKYPRIGKGGGGFFGFCVDDPVVREVLEKFLRAVVPMFKDHPALHSFCLSNEPSFERASGCEDTKAMWEAYLARVHGDIGTLNERFGTSYASFADVPYPGGESYRDPQFYDYVTFIDQRFAGWHKWMADVCHELAPNVPVHAKFRAHEIWARPSLIWGIDPELFSEYMDINGNDCIFAGWPGNGWALRWQLQNKAYDLQRSFAEKPIFDSENHPTLDRCTDYVPPDHFRTCLWQGAVHGQGATTLWVWERSDDPLSDFAGNVMDHPGGALAVGTTCLDLNRFAEEVTALQKAKAPVAILFSMASLIRSDGYLPALDRAYTALNFSGVKIDFISEKQLQAGKAKEYRLIVIPDAHHVLPETVRALVGLPESVKLFIMGDGSLKDPYERPYPAGDLDAIRSRAILTAFDAKDRELLTMFLRELGAMDALPEVSVVDALTGEPAWGVEWLPVESGGRTVINMVNLTNEPAWVKVVSGDREVTAVDMLDRLGPMPVRVLKPMQPVLAEVD